MYVGGSNLEAVICESCPNGAYSLVREVTKLIKCKLSIKLKFLQILYKKVHSALKVYN